MSISADSEHGYIVECDLTYPTHIHDAHSDYPLAPEHLTIWHAQWVCEVWSIRKIHGNLQKNWFPICSIKQNMWSIIEMCELAVHGVQITSRAGRDWRLLPTAISNNSSLISTRVVDIRSGPGTSSITCLYWAISNVYCHRARQQMESLSEYNAVHSDTGKRWPRLRTQRESNHRVYRQQQSYIGARTATRCVRRGSLNRINQTWKEPRRVRSKNGTNWEV